MSAVSPDLLRAFDFAENAVDIELCRSRRRRTAREGAERYQIAQPHFALPLGRYSTGLLKYMLSS